MRLDSLAEVARGGMGSVELVRAQDGRLAGQLLAIKRLHANKEAQTNQEPFAERTVAFICSQICAGLTAAHTLASPDGAPLGLVHRDLTPANVLVSFDGLVKIIDFGIAKAEERISHTRTGQLEGKGAFEVIGAGATDRGPVHPTAPTRKAR
jgi:serine/threonine protein kinase